MRNNQKTSTRMRLLAWLMAMVMMCTSINVSVFAESIGYEDAAVEMQSMDESLVDVEEVEEAEVVSEVQETESSEIEDAYIEEETGMPVTGGAEEDWTEDASDEDVLVIDEGGEEIYAGEMMDSAEMDDAEAGETAPKFVVTTNLSGWAESADDTTLPYLFLYGDNSYTAFTVGNYKIDLNDWPSFQLSNYPSIKENIRFEYVIVDGLRINVSEFVDDDFFNEIDTSGCPNLKGNTVGVGLDWDGTPIIVFQDTVSRYLENDINVEFHFGNINEAKYTLNVTSDTNGYDPYEVKYLRETDDKTGSVYGVYVRPKNGYQLVSYTMDGQKNPLELKTDNCERKSKIKAS